MSPEIAVHDASDGPSPALEEAFVGVDRSTLGRIAGLTETVTLAGGDCLFHEGDPSDALYAVEVGRLRVFRSPPNGVGGETMVSEIGRGELVGEAALLDGGTRGASVYAVRDTRLIRLGRDHYEELLQRDPHLGLHLARVALGRTRTTAEHRSRQACFALVAASAAIDLDNVARELSTAWGPGAVVLTSADVPQGPGLAAHLGELEEEHTHLIYVVDPAWTDWSRQALRSADRVVLVAEASAPPEPNALEQDMWRLLSGHHEPSVSLVLTHWADTVTPTGTRAWVDPRDLFSHHHVRSGDQVTWDRLARLLEGSGTSLVLGGGGARGFAHIGVAESLEELGRPIDQFGGASIGAVMGAGLAMGIPAHGGREFAERAFRKVIDYTLPVSAVLSGHRITKQMEQTFGTLDIVDLWIPFYCVSTNLTRCRAQVHDRGSLVQALRATASIPGVLPPVAFEGDLLVDGGVLDNVPVREMRRRNPGGTVIAVDVAPSSGPAARSDFGLAVSGTRAFLARRRGAGPPRLLTTMTRSTLVASARERNRVVEEGLADVYLDVDAGSVGMLDFAKGSSVAGDAAERVRPVLAAWLEAEASGGSPPGYIRVPRTPQRGGPAPTGRFGIRGVLLLTARDLQMRASRFASAILGTSVVFTMLFLMTGLTEQFHREPRQLVDALGAEAWVLHKGASGAFTSSATLPASLANRVTGAMAVPVVTARQALTEGETQTDIVIVGYTPDELGTPDPVSGRLPDKPGEVLLDRTADIDVGSTATIGGSDYDVVGLTEHTTLLAGMPVVFMPISEAQDLLYEGRRLASALLLDGTPEAVPRGFKALEADEIATDAERPLDGAVSSVNLIRILLWFVAAMIIGTLTYLAALDRRRDVAVLKAVGGRTTQLGASIALQGVLVAGVAVAVAAGLQALLVPVFPLEVVVPGRAFVQLPVIALLVTLASGGVGLRKAVNTDPALAFAGPGQ